MKGGSQQPAPRPPGTARAAVGGAGAWVGDGRCPCRALDTLRPLQAGWELGWGGEGGRLGSQTLPGEASPGQRTG